MDTDSTSRDIPGNVESNEEGKDGRAIAFHSLTLPAVLIICKKKKTIKHKLAELWQTYFNTFVQK